MYPLRDNESVLTRLTHDGLSYRAVIRMANRIKDDSLVFSARLDVERATGKIEGYYQYNIYGITRHFDSNDEAEAFLSSALSQIKQGKSELIFEADRYYVHDSTFNLFIDGINDAEKEDLIAGLREQEEEEADLL